MSDTHVIPVDDLMPHNEHRECWCCPVVDYIGGLNFTVIHNALDMRENRE